MEAKKLEAKIEEAYRAWEAEKVPAVRILRGQEIVKYAKEYQVLTGQFYFRNYVKGGVKSNG